MRRARRLGTLKAIAVTSKQRSPAFPDTPAVAETKGLEDFDFANWFGLLARAGTPQPVLDKLAAAAIGALKEPKVREVLENPGGRSDRTAEFREFIRSESAKYTKIVEITGITLK
jgi:tripartite-type tricarboxylate transporter receptor subunit TctC